MRLVDSTGGPPVLIASACALAAAVLIGFAGIGPNRAPTPRFDPRAALVGVARRAAAARQSRLSRPHVGALRDVGVDRRVLQRELRARAARGDGADGGQARGVRHHRRGRDRFGRRRACSPIGSAARRSPSPRWRSAAPAPRRSASCSAALRSWLVALGVVWGISIVADSAQFSASIAELADRERVGTMLTVQTALGFTLTLVTIHLMPALVDALGWRYAFAPLAIGPALGIWAMARLRAASAFASARRRPALAVKPQDSYGIVAAVGRRIFVRGGRSPRSERIPIIVRRTPWPITSKDACSKSATAACFARAGSAKTPTSAPATRSSPGISTRERSTASTFPTARSR